jgi:tRNA nucleotidyltransferase (CCA-adding enzyme)
MTQIATADNFIARLGFEAYRVGGSVRDEIMGKRPKDADYIIRGVPLMDLKEALVEAGSKPTMIQDRNGQPLGWRVSIKRVGLIEIVLPRREKNAGRGREQVIEVDHTMSLADDALRRDFTFNALYKGVGEGYPETALEGGVIDPTGAGLYDLQHRIIRTTHEDSFRDDPLRTLRALRFLSTLNADLAQETHVQMVEHAVCVDGISDKGYTSGTVFSEIGKLLMGQAPAKALRVARDTGVLERVLPEIAPMLGFDQGSRYHDLTTDEHTFKALETAARVDAPERVRWALLFHDSGKPDSAWVGDDGRKHYYASKRPVPYTWPDGSQTMEHSEDHEVVSQRIWLAAAERLNVDRRLKHDVSTLIRHHMVPTKTRSTGVRVRRMRVQFGDDLLRDLFLHRVCDLNGKTAKVAQNHIQHIGKMESLRAEAQEAGVPQSAKDLKVNGRDAQALGLQGKAIGDALARVLDEVVQRPDEQTQSREWQLARLGAAA